METDTQHGCHGQFADETLFSCSDTASGTGGEAIARPSIRFGDNGGPTSKLTNRNVWLVLIGIFVVIAVAILYVYQAGDRKTVLGNQPIPANQNLVPSLPTGFHVPNGGFLAAAPGKEAEQGFAKGAAPVHGNTAHTVECPRCHTRGLPLCGSCGAVMQPLGGRAGTGMYVCPSCGQVGIPICPHCGSHMIGQAGAAEALQAAATAVQIGGQFSCPVCGAIGLPRWDPSGTAYCPQCGARMRTSGPR